MFLLRVFSICLLLSAIVKTTVPEDLSNFHGEYVCNPNVRLVRPKTIDDVKAAVLRHRRVTAVGAGKSWNKEFFCPAASSDGNTTAAIVMTTIEHQTIELLEEEMAVWVNAVVQTWDLVVYLRDYVTDAAPKGYALGMTPLFLNQTVVGAVATATHGSSLEYSSLSNQVIGFRVIRANGEETEIYPESHPLYFRAFQVNVGRLGVVSHVKMRIVKNEFVKLTRTVGIPFKTFMKRLKTAQAKYKSKAVLPPWMQSVMFWISHSSFEVIEQRIEKIEQSLDDRANSETPLEFQNFQPAVPQETETQLPKIRRRPSRRRDIADGTQWERPTPLPPVSHFKDPNFVLSDDPSTITGLHVHEGIRPRSEAAFALSKSTADALSFVLFDAYEFAIRVDKMADCLKGAVKLLKRMKADNGLRSSIVLRFTGKEEGLLSQAYDAPVMWLDVTEFVYYSQQVRQRNEPFQKFIAYLVTSPKCSPVRRHWGKAGWPDQGCWNGVDDYGLNWCHFGCVVRDLDPENKFIGSAPGTWNWDGAHLDKCCTTSGYDSTIDGCDCNVVSSGTPNECPEAPFYSNR